MRSKGEILAVLPSRLYEVRLEDGRKIVVSATGLEGRIGSAKLVVGKKVCVEVFERRPNRGRIVSFE